MRYVLPSEQVGHIWAAHNMGTTEQDNARNAGHSFSFSGARVLSYSTEVARWIKPSGPGYLPSFVLISSRSYSSTTNGKHMHAVRNALPSGVRVIRFDGPDRGSRFPDDPQAWFADCIRAAEEAQGKAERARTNKEWHLSRAEEAMSEARFLGGLYGFPCGSLDEMTNGLRRSREGAEALANIGRTLRDYFAAMDAMWENLGTAFENINDGLTWLAGGTVAYRLGRRFRHELMPTLLRVEGDKVVTSRGAEFPLEHGLKALPFIKAAIRHGGADVSDQPAFVNRRLGHFRIDRVSPDGMVTAGCHRVPLFAIRWAARAAGACEAPELDHVAAAVDWARRELVEILEESRA